MWFVQMIEMTAAAKLACGQISHILSPLKHQKKLGNLPVVSNGSQECHWPPAASFNASPKAPLNMTALLPEVASKKQKHSELGSNGSNYLEPSSSSMTCQGRTCQSLSVVFRSPTSFLVSSSFSRSIDICNIRKCIL